MATYSKYFALFLTIKTAEEEAFNRAFKTLRSKVERAIGIWKGRWRCLGRSSGYLQYSPEKVCRIVTVCAILHNWLLEINDEGDREVAARDDGDDGNIVGGGPANESGIARRRRLVADFMRARQLVRRN